MCEKCERHGDPIRLLVDGSTRDIRGDLALLDKINPEIVYSVIESTVTNAIQWEIDSCGRNSASAFFSCTMLHTIDNIPLGYIKECGEKFKLADLPKLSVDWAMVIGNAYLLSFIGVEANIADSGYILPVESRIETGVSKNHARD